MGIFEPNGMHAFITHFAHLKLGIQSEYEWLEITMMGEKNN